MHHHRCVPDGFRNHGFLADISSAERESSWRNEGRDRRNHHPRHHVCGVAEGLAVFRLAKEVWNEEEPVLTDKDRYQNTIFFPIGAPNDAYAQYFIGQSYLAPVSTDQIPIFNVTFEPGCRNNWHIHHAKSGGGQMLICVGGRGYYQEWGKDPIEMTPGTVINIPANVKHWHGAAPDSWFSHLAIEVAGEETSNEWLEAVLDEEYNKLS